MTLENKRAPLLYHTKLCASFQIHQWIQIGVTVRKRSIWVKIGSFLSWVTLKIWWMTWKNNRAPLLCYFKLCASFHSHQWIETGVTVRNRPIWVKIDDSFSCVTLKFYGWTSKTIGHLFYATSSFVQHFVAIGEFKLELQSWKAQSGPKSTIFWGRVTLKFDGWPWKTIGHLFYATSSFMHHFIPNSNFWVTVRKFSIRFKIDYFF